MASIRQCPYRIQAAKYAVVLTAWLVIQSAGAVRFDWGDDLRGSLTASLSVGAAWRVEERDPDRVGKLNLPGQYNFCETVDCRSVSGNARYLALPGVPNLNRDDGNLNYDQGEMVAGVVRLVPELGLRYRGVGLNVKAYAFFDVVNYDRDERHPNNFSQNGFQPARTERPDAVNEAIGFDVRILSAYVFGNVPIAGHRVTVKFGDLVISWGEALTLALNSIATISPPDATILHMPGAERSDIFMPVPVLDLSTNLTPLLSVEAFYQFGWKPARLPPSGGYFSPSDIITDGGRYAMLGFGRSREDPKNLAGVQDRAPRATISDAGRTIYRADDNEPEDGGQYGIRLGYFATWLNNTSFGLYFHNLHSRFPFGSFIAARSGCLSNADNAIEVIVNCQGFTLLPGGREPLPADTIRYFRDYPEDIRTFGFSFSTNIGPLTWAGEIAYRPNQPLQIAPIDLGFAALQPMLPDETISLGVRTIPGERVAAPDYVETRFRRQEVGPGQVIRGYERFQTAQYATSFFLLRGPTDNPFGADRWILVLEAGAFHVIDLPPLHKLQIAAPGIYFHHSAGIDGSGMPNAQQRATGAEQRLNPSYQESGFATSWSWGYRLVSKLDYSNLVLGIDFSPRLAFFHDVDGRTPLPKAQFVAGRKKLALALALRYSYHLSSTVSYTQFWGGGAGNLLADRDFVEISLTYDF